jgi:hypothetical protein
VAESVAEVGPGNAWPRSRGQVVPRAHSVHLFNYELIIILYAQRIANVMSKIYEFGFLTFSFTKIESINIKDLIIILSTQKRRGPLFPIIF